MNLDESTFIIIFLFYYRSHIILCPCARGISCSTSPVPNFGIFGSGLSAAQTHLRCSLGGATRIEYRPWEVESVLFVVTFGVIPAVVVVVVTVADSAVFWHFRWPGGLWRPLLGLSEHAEPRW